MLQAAELAVKAYTTSLPAEYVCITRGYDSQAIIHDTGDRLDIAFRGSESVTDWVMNFMHWRTPFPVMYKVGVHAGFMRQYVAIRPDILRVVTRHKQILVTGHSLGGALATLCAAELAVLLPETMVICYTFNAPRVGNIAFVERVGSLPNLRVYRINSCGDVVPCLPPYCGYVHTPALQEQRIVGLAWYDVQGRHSMSRLLDVIKK